MSLYNLPDEVLEEISNYLDIYSLMQLKCVCKKFNSLIKSKYLIKKSNYLLVTNQMSEKFRERCKPLLSSYSSKFFTHYNWINGICKKSKIYEAPSPRNVMYLSSLEMTQNRLWFFYYNDLYAYDRAEDGTVKKNQEDRAIKSCDSFITSIVCCNDVIISGHYDGSIRHWRIESRDNKNNFQLLKTYSNAHNNLINKIDATSQLIASSSIQGPIKIWKNEEGISDEGNIIFRCYNIGASSIAFDPTGTKLAASISSSGHLSSYIIYDINKSHLNEIDGIEGMCHQLLWEDPHTILMCYKKYIKKMDMRTSKFVRIFRDECDRDLSCISTDYLYTIMTGSNYNQTILWDQRKSVSIQTYEVPEQFDTITSVSFDSRHLYIASSTYLYELDFKGYN